MAVQIFIFLFDEGRPLSNPTYMIFLNQSTILNEHKFNHEFEDCVTLLCSCIVVVLNLNQGHVFFLHCGHYGALRADFMNVLK